MQIHCYVWILNCFMKDLELVWYHMGKEEELLLVYSETVAGTLRNATTQTSVILVTLLTANLQHEKTTAWSKILSL